MGVPILLGIMAVYLLIGILTAKTASKKFSASYVEAGVTWFYIFLWPIIFFVGLIVLVGILTGKITRTDK